VDGNACCHGRTPRRVGSGVEISREIDRDQYEQFERLASPSGLEVTIDGQNRHYRIEPTDRVILVYPEPYWTRPIGGGARPNWPKRYQRLEGLLRGKIALRLAGDLHHYMRWTSPTAASASGLPGTSPCDGQLVTCGRNNEVTLWDSNGSKKRSMENPGDLPLRVAFTEDAKQIFAANFEGQIFAWTTADGKPIGKLDANPSPMANQQAKR